MYTKIGRIIVCFAITTVIYSVILFIYMESNQKVIRENEENKGKSLQSFIDRWKYSLYNGLREYLKYGNFQCF